MPRKKNKVSLWAIPAGASVLVLLIATMALPLFYSTIKISNNVSIEKYPFYHKGVSGALTNGILFDVIFVLMLATALVASIYLILLATDFRKYAKTDILARARAILCVIVLLLTITVIILTIVFLNSNFIALETVENGRKLYCDMGFFLYIFGASLILIFGPIEIYRRIKY